MGALRSLIETRLGRDQNRTSEGGQKNKEPTAAEQSALNGTVFNDEGITWKVLKVQWDDKLDSIIVFYCNYDSAQRELIDDDSLHEDHRYVEHSSLGEVLGWIAS